MLWKLLPQIFTDLVVTVVSLLDYVWHDKRTKRFREAMRWFFLLILILMVLSVIAVVKDEAEKEALLTRRSTSVN